MKPTAKRRRGRILFVTGTDTGVGKTVFTGLLLHHLRETGRHALAMKPFCSGGRADVELLQKVQDGELSADEINPFYFPEPVAPLISARRWHRKIPKGEVLRRIENTALRSEWLLVEGSGGLLVPLGEGYQVLDLIRNLDCEVVVLGRNRLGTINHTLLTVKALRQTGVQKIQVVLVSEQNPDVSSKTNEGVLRELLAPIEVCAVNFLGRNANKIGHLKKNYEKVKKTLARFCR